MPTCTDAVHESFNLLQKINDNASNITKCLTSYTQRNVCFEVQKALAINVMVIAISQWNCGVIEAAKCAPDCSCFSAETLRLWASGFVTAIDTCSTDDMSDECISDMLSSNCGVHDEHMDSLLHDENFCLSAWQFLRKNACKKGAPNFTSQMFSKWIETEYNTKIHERTARKWLTKLGFSQIHHQKGVYFDGHDRDDVVAYRNTFLTKMDELGKKNHLHVIIICLS